MASETDAERIARLEARVDYLEAVNRTVLDSLELAASLGDFHTSFNQFDDAGAILRETASRARRLVQFSALAFHLVNEETSDFVPALCEPAEDAPDMAAHMEHLVEGGTLAWTLNRKKPVFVAAADGKGELLLHTLATASRIRGVFVGVLAEDMRSIADATLAVFSIIMLSSANCLESFELYRLVRNMNRNLEEKVRKEADARAALSRQQAKLRELVAELRTEVAERKASQEASRKFEFIANSSRDFLTLASRDYVYEAANRSYLEAVDRSREEVVGKSVAELWGEDIFNSTIRAHFDRCFAGEEVRYEQWFDFLSRGRGFYDVIFSPYRNKDGEITHVSVVSRDITARKLGEERLTASLAEKEVLLQELHHRVKNNLQIITSLMDMAMRRLDDPVALEVCRGVYGKIHAMAMIHTRFHDAGRMDAINVAPCLLDLREQLAGMYGAEDVRFETDVEDVLLPMELAVPCGLVVNELLTNALRHGLGPGRGSVLRLAVRREGDDLRIEVADDGPGLPPAADPAATSGSASNGGPGTMGMKLVANIVRRQLKGSLEATNENGLKVRILFPAPPEKP
ncbi:MAG: PAS domain-containing protein [Desulfovibrionaceae bacterium]|jgi:PAS domain S-box-containing protein|nr:PAS domain-containing protein [Desulfovibrionaceae bacterium]